MGLGAPVSIGLHSHTLPRNAFASEHYCLIHLCAEKVIWRVVPLMVTWSACCCFMSCHAWISSWYISPPLLLWTVHHFPSVSSGEKGLNTFKFPRRLDRKQEFGLRGKREWGADILFWCKKETKIFQDVCQEKQKLACIKLCPSNQGTLAQDGRHNMWPEIIALINHYLLKNLLFKQKPSNVVWCIGSKTMVYWGLESGLSSPRIGEFLHKQVCLCGGTRWG